MAGFLMGSADQPAEIYKAGLNTTRLLMALGNLVIGWLLLTHAEIALRRLDEIDAGHPDHDFYAGKLGAGRFFAATVLPRLAAERSDRRGDHAGPDGAARGRLLARNPLRTRTGPRRARR